MLRTLTLALLAVVIAPGLALAEDADSPPRPAKEVIADLKSKDLDTRMQAVEDSARCHDSGVTSQLIRMLKEKDHEVRMAVIEALGHRQEKACRKKAASALSPRLKPLGANLQYEEEYALTIASLHALAQVSTIKSLMAFDLDENPETAKARLFAVANVPHKSAIETLIAFLSKGRKRGRNNQRQACVQALRYATGQKLGNDPDQWRRWWREVEKDFSFEFIANERAEKERLAAEKKAKQEEKKRRQEEKRRQREERRKKKEREGSGEDA